MAGVLLIHWKPQEIEEQVARLRKHHTVTVESRQQGSWPRELRDHPPDAVLIDLSHLPSHGREIGNFLRSQKATRRVPLIFVGGAPDKVERSRVLLPDAHFCTWRTVRGTVTKALSAAPADPIVPGVFAGYSGTPLPKKLGIKAGSGVLLMGAPEGFLRTLGDLPDGVRVRTRAGGGADVVVLFVRSAAELRKRWGPASRAAEGGGRLWIAWPKKASGLATDLRGNDIREHGLAAGFVDFKICAVDAVWSGLAFVRRERPR